MKKIKQLNLLQTKEKLNQRKMTIVFKNSEIYLKS